MINKGRVSAKLWALLAGLLLVGCSSQTAGNATPSSTVSSVVQTPALTTDSSPVTSSDGPEAAPGGPAIRETTTSAAPATPELETAVVTVTETAAPSSPPAPPAGQASTDPASAPSQDLDAPPAIELATNGFAGFQSPSANIFCAILLDEQGSYVRCDIADFTFQVPEQACDGVGFHAGSAHIDGAAPATIGGCFGDTVVDPSYPVLAYGGRAAGGDISCTSTEAGMICENVISGYGFRLAKASAELF